MFGACWIMKFSVSVMVSVLGTSYQVFKEVMPVGLLRTRVAVVSLMMLASMGLAIVWSVDICNHVGLPLLILQF